MGLLAPWGCVADPRSSFFGGRRTHDERVAVFIDGSNLYHCLKGAFGHARIHFERLIAKLCGGRHLIRTYYYNAPLNSADDPAGYRAQQMFFDRLRTIPLS